MHQYETLGTELQSSLSSVRKKKKTNIAAVFLSRANHISVRLLSKDIALIYTNLLIPFLGQALFNCMHR